LDWDRGTDLQLACLLLDDLIKSLWRLLPWHCCCSPCCCSYSSRCCCCCCWVCFDKRVCWPCFVPLEQLLFIIVVAAVSQVARQVLIVQLQLQLQLQLNLKYQDSLLDIQNVCATFLNLLAHVIITLG